MTLNNDGRMGEGGPKGRQPYCDCYCCLVRDFVFVIFFLAIFSFVKIVIFFNVRLSVVTDNNYGLIVTNNYRLNCIELSMSALNFKKEKQ